ncbi:MAG: hypothetical protein ABIV43_03595 [Candidatus Saccharimonadales bacterium]
MHKTRYFGPAWGLIGFTALIVSALYRLLPHVADAFTAGITPLQWLVVLVWSAVMVYSEGYKGFQKQFSPRFAARAFHLSQLPSLLPQLLAPLYCVGYIYAPKKRKIVSWSLTTGVVLLIIIVRLVPQPWRGIIDTGVILGLAYGIVSVYYYVVRTFADGGTPTDPELGSSDSRR